MPKSPRDAQKNLANEPAGSCYSDLLRTANCADHAVPFSWRIPCRTVHLRWLSKTTLRTGFQVLPLMGLFTHAYRAVRQPNISANRSGGHPRRQINDPSDLHIIAQKRRRQAH